MKSVLREFGLGFLLAVSTVGLLAMDSPAPPTAHDTNLIDPQLVNESPQIKQLMEVMKKEGGTTHGLLSEQFLFASLLWGSVGAGYLFYARKQRQIVPFLGGVAMIAVSCLVASWFWMSIVCVAVVVVVYRLVQQGY